MTHILPPIWLLLFLAGASLLPEAVYTPSLPDIARTLNASESVVEYTLTIYLVGFALGTLFWGKISDKWGRKPCVLAGLGIFILGCVGCCFSPTISMLMISRLVQAFGGSVGSVLGQAICRDTFHGPALGKVYSTMGGALSIFPAFGPVIGGVIAQQFGWPSIFLFLIIFVVALSIVVVLRLPETHHESNRQPVSISKVARALMHDKRVIGFGCLVATCNGITFSYFAEGSFYLISLLGLSPGQYGGSFIMIGVSSMIGGMTSKRLHHTHSSQTIMEYGLKIIAVFTLVFSFLVLISFPHMITVTLLSQMGINFGVCMVTSNALALALVNYKHCIGTASSLFGFFYYALISFFTFGMGWLHNGTLLPMPLYFLSLSVFMIGIKRFMLKD